MNRFMLIRLILTISVVSLPPAVMAAVPSQLAWQGVAIDEQGNPLAAGFYTFHFAIFSDDVGGDSLWGESQTVPVENGVLNVLLGSNTPIPDSAFAGESRYLQVQFESQDPYVPRTKIVSVGYAYRASSVDGATGGTITSAVEVDESVSSPMLLVHPEAGAGASAAATTGNAVVLNAVTDGGKAEFLDEVGAATVVIGPDPDGEGGVITISGDAASPEQGIILDGNGQGTLNPELSVVGANSALTFNMNLSGDEAVSFPMNSLSAPEILDEAGVAAGSQSGAVFDIGDAYVSLASATATYPADGFALIILQSTFRAHEGNTWATGRLLEDGSALAEWSWDPGDPDQYFDERQSYTTVIPVTAGTHSYELRVRHNKGTADAEAARVIVVYLSTNYGAVGTAASVGPEGPAPGEQTVPEASSPLDLATERDESVVVNQIRIADEIAAMQAKLEELQAELQRTRALLEQDR